MVASISDLAARLAGDVTANSALVAVASQGEVLIFGTEVGEVRWPADTCQE